MEIHSSQSKIAEVLQKHCLQAALARVLDLAKTAAPAGDTEHKQLDEVTLLLAVKAFLVAGSPDLLASPATMYPAVNAFSCSLQSRDTAVQTRCLQILTQLVREAELAVAVPYIQVPYTLHCQNCTMSRCRPQYPRWWTGGWAASSSLPTPGS